VIDIITRLSWEKVFLLTVLLQCYLVWFFRVKDIDEQMKKMKKQTKEW